MDQESLLLAALDVLFPDRSYFGGRTLGIQGVPARHLYLSAAVWQFADLDRPVRLLEIGSWVGASALTFAQAIDAFCAKKGSIVCVDPWLDYFSAADAGTRGYAEMTDLNQLGLSNALFQHNIRFARPSVAIERRRGTARDVLPTLEADTFDLVYIDGSHYRDDVVFDIQHGRRLLRDGGLLCGDDLELQAGDCDRAFAEANLDRDFVCDAKGRSFHPGVTLAVDSELGPVSAYDGFWIMRKTGATVAPVALRGANFIVPDHFPTGLQAKLVALAHGRPAGG